MDLGFPFPLHSRQVPEFLFFVFPGISWKMPGWDEQSATQGVKAESSSDLVFDAHLEKKNQCKRSVRLTA